MKDLRRRDTKLRDRGEASPPLSLELDREQRSGLYEASRDGEEGFASLPARAQCFGSSGEVAWGRAGREALREVRSRRRRRRRRSRSLGARVLGLGLRSLAVAVVLSLVAVGALRFVRPLTTALILERRIDAAAEGRGLVVDQRWVPLERIAPSLQLAVVAAEDQRFPNHSGFDFDSMVDALDQASRGRRLRGASTITQQVAKNLFLWSDRSMVRKSLEAYFTLLIEVLWPKRRILEVYLNVVELGPGVFGVEAASRRYFGCSAAELGAFEAARLAAVLPSPRRRDPASPSPHVEQRARWILVQMQRLGPSYVPRD